MVQPSNRDPAQWTLEERWQILIENVKDYAIFMLDPDGKIATWNEGAERILGYTEEEILGHEEQPDLRLTADSETWLAFLAKERSLLWALLRRKIQIKGSPRLLVAFGKCFPS